MTCHEQQNLVTGTMPKIAEFVINHEIWEHWRSNRLLLTVFISQKKKHADSAQHPSSTRSKKACWALLRKIWDCHISTLVPCVYHVCTARHAVLARAQNFFIFSTVPSMFVIFSLDLIFEFWLKFERKTNKNRFKFRRIICRLSRDIFDGHFEF